MNSRKIGQKYFFLICMFSALSVTFSLFAHPITSGQLPSFRPVQSNSQTTDPIQEISNNTVAIGLWVINIFDYEYRSGDYTIDMYLYFFWTNANITTIDWHFANGYPITPTSITLVQSGNSGQVKDEVYRATACLSSAPDASDYPFDKINVTVSIDLLTHGNNLTLSWINSQTGIDSNFNNPGWKTSNVELDTSVHPYPLGVQVPRAEMVITQQRQRSTTSFSPFIAPTIFAVVCAVSFLFGLKEGSSVALRIGLNTSMLVTTLLFSLSIGNSIPPASNMVFYTIFLLSVLIFMVCNLVVTIIGVVGWVKYRNERRTKLANQLGFLISIIVPIIVFFSLLYIRV